MSDRNHGSDDSSPEHIEERIHERQDHLREDLEALESKVSPENLKREARERVDHATEAVKERAVDLTREAGDSVRHRIDDVGDRFRSGEGMSTWSLLGLAAVIGVGLLLTRSSRGRDDERYRAGRTGEGRDPGWAGRDAGRVDRNDLREPYEVEKTYPQNPRS